MVIHNFANLNKALLKVNKKQRWLKRILGALSGSVVSTLAIASPGFSADRIAFYYPPFGEFTLSSYDLETFAETGKITEGFSFYASRIPKSQLGQFRELLRSKFNLSATLVSQFTYSPLGENVVKRFGELIQPETRDKKTSFKALRAALILSAADKEKGLNVLNVIRRYPSDTIRLNLTEGQEILDNLTQLLKRRDAIVGYLKKFSDDEITKQANVDFAQQPDLRLPGKFGWQVQKLAMNDTFRKSRVLQVDLYIPQTKSVNTPQSPFPIIVISHGVAEDRETFAYAGRHLASYGFAVAVIEHPGSDAKKIQQFFTGLDSPPEAEELIDRPLDVKFVLDQLQRLNDANENSTVNLKGKLNLQQVGAIGHSYGGYTALVLAGATIDFQQVSQLCDRSNTSLNLSSFLQCRANELNQQQTPILQDSRIKAVMALNPLNSIVLGKSGLSKIQVPVMLMGGSQDIITPTVPEQVIPFTWLQTPVKYLAVIENGTHFSTSQKLDASPGILPVPPALIGPDPAIAQTYVKAFSVAFFQTTLLNQQQYRPFLTAGYGKYISQPPLNLSLIQSLTPKQLEPFLNEGVGSRVRVRS
jgi:predicted dienelactone hydrolase